MNGIADIGNVRRMNTRAGTKDGGIIRESIGGMPRAAASITTAGMIAAADTTAADMTTVNMGIGTTTGNG